MRKFMRKLRKKRRNSVSLIVDEIDGQGAESKEDEPSQETKKNQRVSPRAATVSSGPVGQQAVDTEFVNVQPRNCQNVEDITNPLLLGRQFPHEKSQSHRKRSIFTVTGGGDCIEIQEAGRESSPEKELVKDPNLSTMFSDWSRFRPPATTSLVYTVEECRYNFKFVPSWDDQGHGRIDPCRIPRQIRNEPRNSNAIEVLNYARATKQDMASDWFTTTDMVPNGGAGVGESLIPRERNTGCALLASNELLESGKESMNRQNRLSQSTANVVSKQNQDKILQAAMTLEGGTPSNRLRSRVQRPSLDLNNNARTVASSSSESFPVSSRPRSQQSSATTQFSREYCSQCPPVHKYCRHGAEICVDDNQRYPFSFGPSKTTKWTQMNRGPKICEIDEAEDVVTALFSDLQTLWVNITDHSKVPVPKSVNLLGMLGLCSFLVKNIEGEWQCRVGFYTSRQRFDDTSQTRLFSCSDDLRGEVVHLRKEKDVMEQEIKELSLQLATFRKNTTNQASDSVFTLPPHVPSCSSTSMGFNLTVDATDQAIKKREDDFNSLMNCIRDRGQEMGSFATQIEQYDLELGALRQTIDQTNAKKLDLERTIGKLEDANKLLSRDRMHYETVLKLVLQEKRGSGSRAYELLQKLIAKLNELGSDIGFEGGLLEGALEMLQEENDNYRQEIESLKSTLSTVAPGCLNGMCQSHAQRLCKDTADRLLNENTAEIQQLQWAHETKYGQLQKIHDVVAQSQAKLEASLAEKSREVKKLNEEVTSLRKAYHRQAHKMDELQRHNDHLRQDNAEQKHKTEALDQLVSTLRSSFTEKSSLWLERARATGDEAVHAQEQCKWFQSQVASLTEQLTDASDRLKCHEKEKKALAKRLLSAEEERKVVDTRLNELRVALQGGNVLTDALMERNDALKKEISRLRRAKLHSLDVTMAGKLDDSEFTPPSEIGTSDVSTFDVSPQPPQEEKHALKKNCFTNSNLNDDHEPRVVVSLHSSSERSK